MPRLGPANTVVERNAKSIQTGLLLAERAVERVAHDAKAEPDPEICRPKQWAAGPPAVVRSTSHGLFAPAWPYLKSRFGSCKLLVGLSEWGHSGLREVLRAASGSL